VAVDQLTRTFAALADPTRRAILGRLAEGEATVNELAEPFPISVQAVSKHLKVLERAGLITRGRTAQLRPSRLQAAPLKDAVDWLEEYRAFWEGSFDRLQARLQATEKGPPMAEASTPGAAAEGITITRVFDAPRERVWKEWTEPERFADWFGGSEAEVPVSTVSMDVREGGAWRATMFAGPGRRKIQWKGAYREVVAPERLVFTVSDQPGDEYELVIVVLTDLGDGRTEMLFQQRGRLSAKQYERAGQGWSSFFDRMAEHLADA
jgi:uncharacterized protein YndB with AHSA1/START domain/DNA-binding transcriptional ArsR family regulator